MITEIKKTLKEIPSGIVTVYCIAIVIMNLLANKSIDFNVSWLALDCGITISWVIFLIMDIVVKKYGAKRAIYLTVISIILNIGIASILFVSSQITGSWGESFSNIQNQQLINTAIDNTIKGNWFIIFGSTVAFLSSTIINGILNTLIGKKVKDNFKGFAIRSYISTLISQISDNFIFAIIVSHTLFNWSIIQCITCSLTGAILEALFEFIFIPVGYKILKKGD